MSKRVVIVGAGQAGAQVAISLRERGQDGPITLVGDEPHVPYQRPPLSKAFLKGTLQPERLQLRPASFYAAQSIELATGRRVERVDVAGHKLLAVGGLPIAYDTLVLATGTRPRPLTLQGCELRRVYAVRNIADVEALRTSLPGIGRIAIVGGGYIGLEIAAVLRQLGKQVTIVEAADRVLRRVTSAPIADYFERLHRRHGVEIITGARIEMLAGETTVTGVQLCDRVISADAVLLAVGAVANQEFAAASGIACDDGILVDGSGRTSAPDIFACGDCARFPVPRFGRTLRIESVQNAIDQSKCVAAAIAGEDVIYDPVPWFWSDQYDTKLQIAGLSEPASDVITIVGDPGSEAFSVEYRRGGRLVAVDAVNSARVHMLARRQISEQTDSSQRQHRAECCGTSGSIAAEEAQTFPSEVGLAGNGPAPRNLLHMKEVES